LTDWIYLLSGDECSAVLLCWSTIPWGVQPVTFTLYPHILLFSD
jgi:hypothetical protein